jgi:hypothetical protein
MRIASARNGQSFYLIFWRGNSFRQARSPPGTDASANVTTRKTELDKISAVPNWQK